MRKKREKRVSAFPDYSVTLLRHQAGVTIVEVMVSIAIGLFILAGVVQLYASATQNSAVVQGSSTIQENARYIFSRLAEDVSQAGFGGCFNLTAVSPSGASRFTNVVAGNNAEGQLYDFEQFIDGIDNEAIENLTFDAFTVRYTKSSERHLALTHAEPNFTIADSAPFKQGDLVLVTNCSRMTMFRVSNEPAGSGVLSYAETDGYNSLGEGGLEDAYEVRVKEQQKPGTPPVFLSRSTMGVAQYRIDTSAAGEAAGVNCSSENAHYCALFRKTTTEGKGDELVEGVQGFEVEYGWQDYNNQDTLYFTDAGSVQNNWNLVDRIKVTATLNSISTAPTNEGVQRMQRSYSRVFLVHNQFPSDTQFREEL
jgi:Tfp pilus assembly protein PilW